MAFRKPSLKKYFMDHKNSLKWNQTPSFYGNASMNNMWCTLIDSRASIARFPTLWERTYAQVKLEVRRSTSYEKIVSLIRLSYNGLWYLSKSNLLNFQWCRFTNLTFCSDTNVTSDKSVWTFVKWKLNAHVG